ncbi:hypothetical protein [Paenibacillus sp. FSL H7-0714]|uniref:hypothetical protein n=1 Tax=Paenibacillus sp. FSL H7-0714 TaxID=2954735 RepID=UPI0030FB0A6D
MTGELLVKNPIDYLFNSTFDLTGIEDQIVALYAKKNAILSYNSTERITSFFALWVV